MLTKVLALVLVVLIGLALGIETARYVHSAGGASTGVVNIHHAVFAGVLLAVLWLSRAWLARQWTRFSVWFELTLDELSNAAIIASMERRLAEVPSPGTPDYEACAQDALDDAAKTTCTGCGDRGHWWPDCPAARPPPSREPDRGR